MKTSIIKASKSRKSFFKGTVFVLSAMNDATKTVRYIRGVPIIVSLEVQKTINLTISVLAEY